MRARFIGDPRRDGEGPSLLPFMGVVFIKGEWSEDLPEPVAKKVSGNSHFETSDDAAPEVEVQAETSDISQDHDAEIEPLDHDGDGQKGGAVQVDQEVEALRADLTALSVDFDRRWGVKKLRAALEAATAPE